MFHWQGAIAQLGERLLCKQEVVGSIPSGSTINGHRDRSGTAIDWRSRLTRGAAVELVPRKFEEMPSGVRLVLFSNREEVTQSSFLKGTRPHRGGSDDECVHEVSWSFRSVPNFKAFS